MQTVTHTWQQEDVLKDLRRAGLTRVFAADEWPFGVIFSGVHESKPVRTKFSFNWKHAEFLALTMSRNDNELVGAFSAVLGVKPFQNLRGENGNWIYEWNLKIERVNPEENEGQEVSPLLDPWVWEKTH